MSVIRMPFLHRFIGRTPRNGEIRHLAAWDSVEIEIPTRHVSEFDIGSRLTSTEVLTYTANNDHWAYADDHVMSLSGKGADEARIEDIHPSNLLVLMKKIGGSKFFDDGAVRLKDSDVLSKTPPAQYVEVSQRDAIVERIAEYASDNFADVDGHLLTRVHEPSLCLKAWNRPNGTNKCYLQLNLPFLVPWHGTTHDAGLHFDLNSMGEIEEFSRALIGHDSSCDELLRMFDPMKHEGMISFEDPLEDMRTRSLLGVAAGIAARRTTKPAANTDLFRRISALSLKTPSELTEEEGGMLLDALNAPQAKLNPAEQLMVQLAEEQWNARPLNAANLVMAPGLHC